MSKEGEVVLLLVLVIATAIAAPNRIGGPPQSNESAAIGNMRTIIGAETAYHSAKGTYTGRFTDMTDANPPFLDGKWGVTKQGYYFTLTVINNGQGFEVVALPREIKKGSRRGFYTDASGVIRAAKEGVKPSATSTPIGQD